MRLSLKLPTSTVLAFVVLAWISSQRGAPVQARVGGERIAWQVATLPPAVGHRASIAEPGVDVGPHGTLVVNAADANAGYPTWWISRDGGRHWGPGRDFDTTGAMPMTGDADAAFGADGYLYALNLAFATPPQQPTNPTIFVYASRDWRHFRGPAGFPPPHGTDQPDRPWLVPDPYRPSRVLVTNSEGAGNVVMWTSTDRARTFSGPTLITGGDHGASIELTSRPLFDTVSKRRIYMLYEASAPDQATPPQDQPLREFPLTQLWLAESGDAGGSWTNRLALDIVDAFGSSARGGSLGHVLPASAISEEGILYAAFSLRLGRGTETHIFLIHSTDHGVHWSRPVQVDSGGLRSNVMPSVAAGTGGRVDVSWYGSRSPDFIDPHARWVEMFAQSVDALSGQPTFTQSRVSGVTHVGSIDSAGNPGSSQYDWGLRDFQSVTFDACGMAHLAWTDDVGRGSAMTARQISGPSPCPVGGAEDGRD